MMASKWVRLENTPLVRLMASLVQLQAALTELAAKKTMRRLHTRVQAMVNAERPRAPRETT